MDKTHSQRFLDKRRYPEDETFLLNNLSIGKRKWVRNRLRHSMHINEVDEFHLRAKQWATSVECYTATIELVEGFRKNTTSAIPSARLNLHRDGLTCIEPF